MHACSQKLRQCVCMYSCVHVHKCKAEYVVLVSCKCQAERSPGGQVVQQIEKEKEAGAGSCGMHQVRSYPVICRNLQATQSLYVCVVSGVISGSCR